MQYTKKTKILTIPINSKSFCLLSFSSKRAPILCVCAPPAQISFSTNGRFPTICPYSFFSLSKDSADVHDLIHALQILASVILQYQGFQTVMSDIIRLFIVFFLKDPDTQYKQFVKINIVNLLTYSLLCFSQLFELRDYLVHLF